MVKILGFGYGGAPKPLSFKGPGEYSPGAEPVCIIVVEYLNSLIWPLLKFKDGPLHSFDQLVMHSYPFFSPLRSAVFHLLIQASGGSVSFIQREVSLLPEKGISLRITQVSGKDTAFKGRIYF